MTAAARSDLAALFDRARVIPVITIDHIEDAVPLARALVAGGVDTLEVTLRTAAGAEAARAIMAEVPDAVVGLGTVLRSADVALGLEMGAAFLVSPGATPALLDAAAATAAPLVPGIATASEVMAALERGFTMQKFFPAAGAGGPAALKGFAGPFPGVRFCPTGGIAEQAAPEWLALPNVVAVGGSWLCPRDAVRAQDWDTITAIAARTHALVH